MTYDDWRTMSYEDWRELQRKRSRYHKRGTPPAAWDDSPEADAYWDQKIDEAREK